MNSCKQSWIFNSVNISYYHKCWKKVELINIFVETMINSFPRILKYTFMIYLAV